MIKLFDIAETAGVTVEYLHLPCNKSMSVADPEGDFVLMDYSLIKSGAEESTRLAHELGHCITGSFYNPYTAFDLRVKHENRADKWAINRLISERKFRKVVKDGLTDLSDLADYFNVTVEFMRKAVCLYLNGNLAVDQYV